jgi:hypothetical protein
MFAYRATPGWPRAGPDPPFTRLRSPPWDPATDEPNHPDTDAGAGE